MGNTREWDETIVKVPLYILQYNPNGLGCPHHLSGEYNHAEWEWQTFEARPHDVEIKKTYSLQLTDGDVTSIDFDFYGSAPSYVSDQFVSLCNDYGVDFRTVPLEITYLRGTQPEKSYFVFLPADHLAVVDCEKSVAEVDLDCETGQPAMDPLFPGTPVFRRIEKLVIKDIETPHLFQCVDLFSMVCTETFRAEALKRGLRGLEFIALDENYIYDPWAGW